MSPYYECSLDYAEHNTQSMKGLEIVFGRFKSSSFCIRYVLFHTHSRT